MRNLENRRPIFQARFDANAHLFGACTRRLRGFHTLAMASETGEELLVAQWGDPPSRGLDGDAPISELRERLLLERVIALPGS